MRASVLLVVAAATLVGGCQSQSEAEVRGELRAQMLERCNRDIVPATNELPGFDSAAYCNCVTDRAMGERNLGELKTLFADRDRMTREGRQAATECLAAQGDATRRAVVIAPEPEPEAEKAAPATTRRRAPAMRPPATRSAEPAPDPEPEPIDKGEEEPGDRM